MKLGSVKRKGEGDGEGCGCLVLIGIIAVAIYSMSGGGGGAGGNKGGGGNGGGVADWFKPDPKVSGLKADWDTGLFSHDLLLTNGSGDELREVDMTLTFTTRDAKTLGAKQHWTTWVNGETQKINVKPEKYQKLQAKGTAKKGEQRVQIDSEWSWNWK